jgi:hypothetical protein
MKWSCLYLIAGIFFLSCTTRPVTPSRASRKAIDTIFQKQVLLMQPKMDSICTLLHDSIYAVAVDSILNERRSEMMELVE